MATASTPTQTEGHPDIPDAADAERVRRQLLRLGVGGAVLASAVLLIFQVFAIAPFRSADESPHVDYALAVTHGDIPQVGARVLPQLPQQPGTVQFLSFHPPLYHVVVGAVLRVGLAVHHPLAGLFAARLLTALCTIGTVVLVALLALSFPGRYRAGTAVAAAAVAGAFDPLQQPSVAVMNDAPAALLGTAVLLLLVRIIRFGATRARLVGLTLCCAAAMLVRVSLVGVVAIAVLGLVLAAVLPPPVSVSAAPPESASAAAGSPGRRLGRGVGQAALVLAGVLVASGWFYRLNLQRYGSVTGETYLRGDHSAASAFSFVLDPGSMWHLWQR